MVGGDPPGGGLNVGNDESPLPSVWTGDPTARGGLPYDFFIPAFRTALPDPRDAPIMSAEIRRRRVMGQRDVVFPTGRRELYDKNRYSPAVRAGDLLFVSGQVGSRPDGSPEPDFEKQVRLAFANLGAVLDAAGVGFEDVVDVTTFHTDPERQMDTVQRVKNAIFDRTPYPNWTAVGVTWLSGFDFEIKIVARIPKTGVG